jgi:aminopeptidase
MSLEAFADFVFEATFSDRADPIREWEKLGERQKTIVARLCGADTMRIVGGETDLRLSVKGRPFTSCDGRINMPCGEVFAAPIEHSADGKIFFDVPSCWSGREISGIRIVFRRGRVVEASAEKNGKFLSTLIATDAGASRIGELAIGTNFRIRRFTKNILFDEKVGGTVHLALGNAYPESGGKNKSAIHWDMIKDLRKDGAVYVDGRPLLKNGKFV